MYFCVLTNQHFLNVGLNVSVSTTSRAVSSGVDGLVEDLPGILKVPKYHKTPHRGIWSNYGHFSPPKLERVQDLAAYKSVILHHPAYF
jgi:hypothetical protein